VGGGRRNILSRTQATNGALKEAARYRGKYEDAHEELHALRSAVSVTPRASPLPCRPLSR